MGDKQPPVGHYIDKDGYRWLTMQQGHPLAGGSGGLAEHRKVLYEKIGPGEHSCHWCGKSLGWGQFMASSLTISMVTFSITTRIIWLRLAFLVTC